MIDILEPVQKFGGTKLRESIFYLPWCPNISNLKKITNFNISGEVRVLNLLEFTSIGTQKEV